MTEHEHIGNRADRRKSDKWYEKTRYQFFLFALGVAVFGLVLWTALDWYISPQTPAQKKDLVQALGLITAGVAGAFGIFFTWRGQRLAREAQEENQLNTLAQLDNAREQLMLAQQTQADNQANTQEELDITRRGQITERFTRAIDQLGDDRREVRIGGIYALARIAAEDSDNVHYWPVIEVLTAYIRTNVPYPSTSASNSGDSSEHEEDLKVEAKLSHQHRRLDIQAILYILRDRKHHYGNGEDKYIWLTHTDLQNGDLRKVHLERARLRGANLQGARLNNAHLWRARLRNVNLEEADLEKADLQGADLEESNLRNADLRKAKLGPKRTNRGVYRTHLKRADLHAADLREADLSGADLSGADLSEADLSGSKGIANATLEQQAASLKGTIMPDGSRHP